jgi:hypothetical protein
MKDVTDKERKLALKLHKEGKTKKEIREATDLNYSQLWVIINDAELPDNLRVKEKDRTPATVRKLRSEDVSWGMIALRFGIDEYPEGRIRRMFEEATGDKSQGQRIGHGGRFLLGEPRLYAGDRRRPGVALPKELSLGEIRDLAATLDPSDRAVAANGKRPSRPAAARVSHAVKAAKVAKPVKATKKATRQTPAKATKKATKAVS